MKPTGQLHYFRSDVDGKLHPCAVCATDTSHTPKPLIVEVSPGALGNLAGAVALTEQIAGIAAKHNRSCVVLRPTGRGSGSVYQNYGEVDVLEAIEHTASNYAIDRDRITITGASMGGAATWYLISHYPDLFAAAAPFCGYCDYRLWEKPGGLTFHLHEWEEPSWKSRSAAFLIENLAHTPVWIVHGEWDRGVGGGVPVEHSRQMAQLLEARGYPYQYTEVPKTGHGCRTPDVWEQVILWLLEQRKQSAPNHVPLATYDLRHNRSYWVTIDQLSHYGERGMVDARFVEKNRIVVHTENVRTFSLGPMGGDESAHLVIDDQAVGDMNLSCQRRFQRSREGVWAGGNFDLAGEKRHRASGPISDLFFDGLILVPGTVRTEEETFFTRWVAENAVGYYRSRNGGVHRGGIMGDNAVDLPTIPDVELSEERLRANNLLLYGTDASNAIFARFKGRLPIAFEGQTICLSDKSYAADGTAIFAVFPHPDNPERYVAVHGGVTPDAICWGSHLDMQLLPDYIVYSGGKLLDWGFWGNDWKSQHISENS
ncbi:prolyl oligopeptidase family serine peptidase [Candidatus Poribacteria bacterium]|nr:prolyl oligopeptidase family serine peptidase [Candidatus Poribacteria bacterium]